MTPGYASSGFSPRMYVEVDPDGTRTLRLRMSWGKGLRQRDFTEAILRAALRGARKAVVEGPVHLHAKTLAQAIPELRTLFCVCVAVDASRPDVARLLQPDPDGLLVDVKYPLVSDEDDRGREGFSRLAKGRFHPGRYRNRALETLERAEQCRLSAVRVWTREWTVYDRERTRQHLGGIQAPITWN